MWACHDVNSSKSVFPFKPGPVPHIIDLSSLRKREEMVRSTLLSIPGTVASHVALTPTLQEWGGGGERNTHNGNTFDERTSLNHITSRASSLCTLGMILKPVHLQPKKIKEQVLL